MSRKIVNLRLELVVPEKWPNQLLLETVKSTINVALFREKDETIGVERIEIEDIRRDQPNATLF